MKQFSEGLITFKQSIQEAEAFCYHIKQPWKRLSGKLLTLL